MLRQVTSHQKCVQLLPVRLLIVAFAASDHHESGPVVEPPRRLVILLDFKKYDAHAAPCEMAEMGHQQHAGQAAAAMGLVDRDREDFRFVRADPRHRKADRFAAKAQPMHERVALAHHGLELALTPAMREGGAVKLCKPRGIARGRWLDGGGTAAPP